MQTLKHCKLTYASILVYNTKPLFPTPHGCHVTFTAISAGVCKLFHGGQERKRQAVGEGLHVLLIAAVFVG